MNIYERIFNILTETRSATSRAKTKGRKMYGTNKGRQGEYARREAAGKSVRAYGHGQRAAKDIASAKVYRQAASDIESHSKTHPGPDPKRRKDVTATATTALRDTASRKEQAGRNQIKQGKQAAGNKRAVNRTLKRDETKKNLGKLSIRNDEGHKDLGPTKMTKLFGKSAAKNLALGNKTEFAKKVLGGMRLAGKLPFQTHGKRTVKKK